MMTNMLEKEGKEEVEEREDGKDKNKPNHNKGSRIYNDPLALKKARTVVLKKGDI